MVEGEILLSASRVCNKARKSIFLTLLWLGGRNVKVRVCRACWLPRHALLRPRFGGTGLAGAVLHSRQRTK